MKWFYAIIGIIILGLLAFILLRGGGHETKVTRDFKPFDQAVVAFLKSRSFGMKPVKLLELSIQGNSATATYKLKDAEGAYNLAVIWEFRFRKEPDGEWVATGYEKR